MDRMLPARRIVDLAAPLPVLLLVAGCVTGGRVIQDLGDEARYRDSLVYAGTRYHLEEIPRYRTRARMHWASQAGHAFRWWHYLDLPLCFCADTLLLPYTVPRSWYTHRQNLPSGAKRAVQPLIDEYAACIRAMRELEADKITHAHGVGTGSPGEPPREIGFYRAWMDKPWNKGPFYVCPAGGEYRVGLRGEEPSCSVHGTLSEATRIFEFVCREKRLPDSIRGAAAGGAECR
jgi:uncharacterized protein YceK